MVTTPNWVLRLTQKHVHHQLQILLYHASSLDEHSSMIARIRRMHASTRPCRIPNGGPRPTEVCFDKLSQDMTYSNARAKKSGRTKEYCCDQTPSPEDGPTT